MAGIDLAAISAVLARQFDLPVIRQIAEASVLFSELPKRPYQGKAADWRVSGDGRTVSKVASGADAPAATQNEKKLATLGWGRYTTVVQIGFDAITAALNAPGDMGAINLLEGELIDGVRAIAKDVNADLYAGLQATADSVVGLAEAIDSTGTYAGINQAVDAWWASHESGAGVTLTTALLDTALETVGDNYGANLVPGRDIIVCRGDLHKKLSQLETAGGNKQHVVSTAPGQTGQVILAGGRTALWYDGLRVIKDTQCTASFMYLIRMSEIAIRFMPFTLPGTSDVVMRNVPSGDQEQETATPVMVHVIPLARAGDHVKLQLLVQIQLVSRSRYAHGKLNVIA